MPTAPFRLRVARAAFVALLALALVVTARPAAAQVRERPVAFDSAGRIMTVTPPLVARLGLVPPTWPVSGDFLEARLYEVGDAEPTYVIVVRRQREVLERFALDAAQRAELAAAIGRSIALSPDAGTRDSMPTYISEPVRGQFVLNQTVLGATLFGPAAAAMVGDPAGGFAAYLLVTGGSFFYSTALTQTTPVSRAQNHLSAHSAVRGAIAGNLLLYSLAGDTDVEFRAAATLAGGLLGDVVGFQLAKPMTDAEAHGTAHGSTVTAALTAGLFGTFGAYDGSGGGRAASAGILVAGLAGYPLGLRYVRSSPYNVTAGDIGAMLTAQLLGATAALTLIPDNPSGEAAFGLLTAGYAAGVIAGDRLLVRPFDYTESDARLMGLGTVAGGLLGVAIPVLAEADDPRPYWAGATIGGVVGAILTHNLIQPDRARAGSRGEQRTGAARRRAVDVNFSTQGALMAGSGIRGNHSLLSLSF